MLFFRNRRNEQERLQVNGRYSLENENRMEGIIFLIKIEAGISFVFLDDTLDTFYTITMSLFIMFCCYQLFVVVGKRIFSAGVYHCNNDFFVTVWSDT